MSKKKKKRSFVDALKETRNLVHYQHLLSNVNAGIMGVIGKRKNKKDRKKDRQECRKLESG